MLLRTKFSRPSIPHDFVVRPRLTDALNRGLSHPLTLICAPAGYGKTSLASYFLDACPLPSVWLSLDKYDNDFCLFLEYLLAALDAVFPQAVRGTQLLLAGIHTPQVAAVADSLINELAELGRPLILALDDGQELHEPDTVGLINALLRRPLPGLHVMLLTRREPMLALGTLRARGQITDIRARDLRFSAQETAAFMDRATGAALRDDAIAALAESTEGWAAGLRLAVLTLRHGGDVDGQIARSHAENRYVIDYLVSEVRAHIPSEISDFLLKTSILSRLCGPLCDAVLAAEGPAAQGQARLAWLEDENFFTTSLDEQRVWYRYHHLFRALLQKELMGQLGAEEIRSLHCRASAWYASHGDMEEALRHALAGHDTPGAVSLLAQERHHLLNTEQRPRLERWLNMFSAADVAEHADLLLSRAWLAELGRADPRTVLELLDEAQALVDGMAGEAQRAGQLQGEIDTLRSTEKIFAANDPAGVIALATRALETMPKAWYLARVEAWLYLALAHQMSGQLERAYAVLAAARREGAAEPSALRVRHMGLVCFVDWVAADLPGMLQSARQLVKAGQANDQQLESLGWGHYFLASCYYQRNDLAAAELHASVVQAQRYACHRITVVQSAIVLASIQQARGFPEQARLTLDRVNDFLVEIRSHALLPLVHAFEAELVARQGNIDAASVWAATVGPLIPFATMAFFYTPQLTLPKVLLAINTPESRQQAAAALARLHTFVTKTHNIRFTIDVLALQAVLYQAEGSGAAALRVLEQAVTLAKPGGWIRVFVDLGPALAGPLKQLSARGIAPAFIEQILNAFPPVSTAWSPPSTQPVPQANLIEPLTWRELEVLELLVRRFSAKEIAQHLVISEATAKKHTMNIFQKLGVNSRRQAVNAAMALGLLPARTGQAPDGQG